MPLGCLTEHNFVLSARIGGQVYQPVYGMDIDALCLRLGVSCWRCSQVSKGVSGWLMGWGSRPGRASRARTQLSRMGRHS